MATHPNTQDHDQDDEQVQKAAPAASAGRGADAYLSHEVGRVMVSGNMVIRTWAPRHPRLRRAHRVAASIPS